MVIFHSYVKLPDNHLRVTTLVTIISLLGLTRFHKLISFGVLQWNRNFNIVTHLWIGFTTFLQIHQRKDCWIIPSSHFYSPFSWSMTKVDRNPHYTTSISLLYSDDSSSVIPRYPHCCWLMPIIFG